ncbi:hypothetical protein Tco_0971652, partial [Tanacetum coccineum]
KDSILQAGNPVKEILLKLNLPIHRSILMNLKMEVEVPESSCLTRSIAICSYPINKHKDFIKSSNTYVKTSATLIPNVFLKVTKNHKSTRWQSFKMAKRLCLVDDLKMLKITMSNTSSRNKLNPEINDHYNILTGECQKDELKTKDKALRTIDQSAGGKLRDKNIEESWAPLEDLALYDNESWNDPRDFAKPVKEISLPQDVPNTSDRRLIELENQVQRLMEAHLAPKSHVQTKQEFEADFKQQQQGEMTNKIDTFLKAINDRMTGALPSDTVKNLKLNINSTSLVLSARSYPMEDPKCSSHIHNSIHAIKMNSSSPKRVHFINTITILSKEDEPKETWIIKLDTNDNDHDIIVKVEEESKESEEEGKEEKDDPEYINTNPPSPPNPSISFIKD